MRLFFAIFVTALMWIIWIFFGTKATEYGIHPRDISSWSGLLSASFIHGSLSHLMSNTLPIFFLTWMLSIFYKKIDILVWILITITGGLLVWLFGRGSYNGTATYHIGSSLTIFGLLGFFIAGGIFRKEFKSLLFAILIGVIYGSVIFSGIFQAPPGVSWEAHLFGFIAGIFWAYIFRKSGKKTQKILPDKMS